jgi:hypothetical protein
MGRLPSGMPAASVHVPVRRRHGLSPCAWLGMMALVLMAVVCSGCVYLRLLTFQHQLADFDHTIVIPDDGRLTVGMRHPCLQADDATWIIGGPPTQRRPLPGGGERWTYTFAKLPIPGDDPRFARVRLDLAIEVQDGLIAVVHFPDQILQVVPRQLCLAMLRSMGRATVDTQSRSAHSSLAPDAMARGPGSASVIPDQRSLIAALGLPLARAGTHGDRLLVFPYRLHPAADQAPAPPVLATLILAFHPGAVRPHRCTIQLPAFWCAMDLPDAAGPAADGPAPAGHARASSALPPAPAAPGPSAAAL